MTKKAYETTNVGISKSRGDIDAILRKWGVTGISWGEDYDSGIVVLRFRWRREDDGQQYSARFTIQIETDKELEERAIDNRSGRHSDKKHLRLKNNRGKREHRVLFYMLKSLFEAVEEGLMVPEQVFLPWIEDIEGMTIFERIGPVMGELTGTSLPKALEGEVDG
jgi:hypothetical protein